MPSSSISYHLPACGMKSRQIKGAKKERQLRRREVIGPALTLKMVKCNIYDKYPPITPMRNRQIGILSTNANFCLLFAYCILLLDLSVSVFYQFLGSVSVVPYALYVFSYVIRAIKSR
jgi:hypothetical protein